MPSNLTMLNRVATLLYFYHSSTNKGRLQNPLQNPFQLLLLIFPFCSPLCSSFLAFHFVFSFLFTFVLFSFPVVSLLFCFDHIQDVPPLPFFHFFLSLLFPPFPLFQILPIFHLFHSLIHTLLFLILPYSAFILLIFFLFKIKRQCSFVAMSPK